MIQYMDVFAIYKRMESISRPPSGRSFVGEERGGTVGPGSLQCSVGFAICGVPEELGQLGNLGMASEKHQFDVNIPLVELDVRFFWGGAGLLRRSH
jgi:hypothetical protein